jgi:hypothetical protein
MSRGRRFLGSDPSFTRLAGFRRVFEIEDALEVDENSFVEIERTRVYFDDVIGLMYHREFGVVFLIAMGFVSLLVLVGLGSLATLDREVLPVVIITGIFGLPFLTGFILRLIFRVDVITVYGRRTMARIKFSFRKGRAREIYRDLALKIRERQEKAAAAQAPPPAPQELPMPPSPSDEASSSAKASEDKSEGKPPSPGPG